MLKQFGNYCVKLFSDGMDDIVRRRQKNESFICLQNRCIGALASIDAHKVKENYNDYGYGMSPGMPADLAETMFEFASVSKKMFEHEIAYGDLPEEKIVILKQKLQEAGKLVDDFWDTEKYRLRRTRDEIMKKEGIWSNVKYSVRNLVSFIEMPEGYSIYISAPLLLLTAKSLNSCLESVKNK